MWHVNWDTLLFFQQKVQEMSQKVTKMQINGYEVPKNVSKRQDFILFCATIRTRQTSQYLPYAGF